MRPLGTDRPRRRRGRPLLALVALLAAAWVALALVRVGEQPAVEIEPELPAIGQLTPIEVRVSGGGRGLGEVIVELVQGGASAELSRSSYEPPSPWAPWRHGTLGETLTVEAGPRALEGLEEGEATLRVTARAVGTWLRRPAPTVVELELPVRLRPPVLTVLSDQHYVTQGGAEAVVYAVGETAVRDGVEAGGRWFPGFPLPGGGAGERFVLFAAPYDLDDPEEIRLVAVDDVGNRAETAFVDRFSARPFDHDRIRLDRDFLERVVPPILAQTPGLEAGDDLLGSYLAINGELRRDNADELERLAADSRPEFLWSESFLALPNGQVMSSFADRRTYLFEGREVDQQDHLGYDLASVRRAPIPAANDGVVVLARFFGIYGNAVVIDHGYGLLSLYGHLSSLAVSEGERVARGDTVGRTGATGLAGGDHLHFTMLLHGAAVDPVEWWDPHWIADRLDRKLGEALPFGS